MMPLPFARRENPRRRALFILAWLLAAPALAGGSGMPALELAGDFVADAALARERGIPILVFYSRIGCPWCEQARREQLLPLAGDPGSRNRVLIREVVVGSDAPISDFSGRATAHDRFARERSIRLVPTMDFLDDRGNRLVDPIVGMRGPDFYGASIERAIDESLQKLRAKPRSLP